MTISINSIPVPTTPNIRNNGDYVYVPFSETVENGLGETVTAGLAHATWRFSVLEQSAWIWWVTTLMAGAVSLRCPAVLLDDKDVETSFSSVVVRYPTYSKRVNGLYMDVVVEIDSMVPA